MGSGESLLEKKGYSVTTQGKQGEQDGKGTFVVTHKNRREYFIKSIKMENMTQEKKNEAKRVQMLSKIKHRHVVHYRESFEDEADNLYVVMEYCKHGDLAREIELKKEQNSQFSEDQILEWFIQICLGLKHVHDDGIVHRDIKPQNIFFSNEKSIKLGDFRVGKFFSRKDVYAKAQPGTPLYVSPEVWKKETFSKKSDIWALGCVLYELCTLTSAFPVEDNLVFFWDLWNGPKPPSISFGFSPELISLVNELLQRDPTQRPSVDDILRKPFITQKLQEVKVLQAQPQTLSPPASGQTSEIHNNEAAERHLCNEFQHLKQNTDTFYTLCGLHMDDLQKLVGELKTAADGLERVHFQSTVGSLAGGVVGAAGGITSVVGLILAPFTLGVSLVVTGVGIGVAVAGGVTSAASNITNMANQSAERKNVERIINEFREKMEPIIMSLDEISMNIENLQKHQRSLSDPDVMLNVGCRLGRGFGGIAELTRLVQVSSIGRAAAQTARAIRVAEAFSGVLAGVFLILDVIFIYKDSKEIHNLRTATTQTREEIDMKSAVMKVKHQILDIASLFQKIIDDVNHTKEEMEANLASSS